MKELSLAALVALAGSGVARADCVSTSLVLAFPTTAVVSPLVITAAPTVIPSPVVVQANGCFLNQRAVQVLVAPSVVRTQVVRQRVRVIQSRRGR